MHSKVPNWEGRGKIPPWEGLWVFPRIGGKPPKMDGENNGKPYFLMDDLGKHPYRNTVQTNSFYLDFEGFLLLEFHHVSRLCHVSKIYVAAQKLLVLELALTALKWSRVFWRFIYCPGL